MRASERTSLGCAVQLCTGADWEQQQGPCAGLHITCLQWRHKHTVDTLKAWLAFGMGMTRGGLAERGALLGDREGLDGIGDVCTVQQQRQQESAVLGRLPDVQRRLRGHAFVGVEARCDGAGGGGAVGFDAGIDGCSVQLMEDLQLSRKKIAHQL